MITAQEHNTQENTAPDVTKQTYKEKTQLQLDKLNAQLEEIKAKAAQAEADAKVEYHNVIEELTAKRDALQTKLDELGTATEGAWKEIQTGAEKALGELQSAFDKAMTNFK